MTVQISYEWDLSDWSELPDSEYFVLRSPNFTASPDKIAHHWELRLIWSSTNPDWYGIYIALMDNPLQPVLIKFSFKVFGHENKLISEFSMGLKPFIKLQEAEEWGVPMINRTFNKIKDINKVNCLIQIKRDENCVPVDKNIYRFSAGLEKDMVNLYADGKSEFADTTICCQDQKFKVHRSVLIARSSVLKTMFLKNKAQRLTNVVVLNIDGIGPAALEEVLKYLYTGKINILFENIKDFLNFSERFDIISIKNLCIIELERSITIETAVHILILSDQFKLWTLKKKVLTFFRENTSEILCSNSWKETMPKRPDLMETLMRFVFVKNDSNVKVN